MTKQYHCLTGLPRSGSTLLANVLSQHPDVYVSGTSALPRCVEVIGDVLSSAAEVQSDLANVPGAQEQYRAVFRGLIDGWYSQRDEPVIIDKARGWVLHRLLMDQVLPSSVMLVTVRDPRNVVASIERNHRRTAEFNSPIARTLYETADMLMSPEGMIGGPCRLIEDAIRRDLKGMHYVSYEALVANPLMVLQGVSEALGLEEFTPDVENVEDHATDEDALYFGKYPHHDAVGAIKPTGLSWDDVLDPELAELVASRWPLYMQTFGYLTGGRRPR